MQKDAIWIGPFKKDLKGQTEEQKFDLQSA